MNSPKNGDIFYNFIHKQFVIFTSSKREVDSGISCILTMSGQIETLNAPMEYMEEITGDDERNWEYVGNLTTILRKCI